MGQITKATLVTAAGLGIGRGIGLAREIVVAALFGISHQMDVWVVAFALIGVPSAMVMNAIQTALIPALSANDHREDRARLLGGALTISLLLMAAGGLVLLAWGDSLVWLIRPDSSEADLALATQLLRLLLPYYFFNAVSMLGYGALQATRRFHGNALLPIIPSVLAIIVLLSVFDGQVNAIAIAVSTGAAIECLTLAGLLRREGLYLLLPRSPLHSPQTTSLARQAAWYLPGTMVFALLPIVEQSIAASLGAGANAALAYGQRIPSALNGLASTALGVAVLPFFASAIARDGPQAVSALLERESRRLAWASAAVALVLAMSSYWIVRLLYERGAFDSSATSMVAAVQAAYFMQLPGMIVGMLYTRLAVAQGRARLLTLLSFATVLTQVALAWLLSRFYGLAGMGLAAALTSAINAIALIALLKHLKPRGG